MGLFGSIGKAIGGLLGGHTSKPKYKQYPRYTPKQEEVLNKMLDWVSPNIGKGIEPYSGQLTAQTSPLLKQAFENVQDLGMQNISQSQPYQQGLGLLSSLAQPYSPEQAQQYWQQAFYEPALRQYEQDLLPKLQERFIANNAVDSSAFNRAIARSSEDLMKDLGSKLAETIFQDRARRENLQASLPAQFMQYAQTPLNFEMQKAGLLSNLGQIQRGIEQQGLQEQYQKWLMSQPWNSPYNKLALSLLGQQAYIPYIQPGSYQPGLLSALGQGASLFAGSKLASMLPFFGA